MWANHTRETIGGRHEGIRTNIRVRVLQQSYIQDQMEFTLARGLDRILIDDEEIVEKRKTSS